MTTVLFLLAAALAVPTFGISLLAFFIGKWVWDRLCSDQLAKHASMSVKNGGEVYTLQRINAAAIRRFFDQRGTQVPRYTFHPDLAAYAGEVALPEADSVWVTIARVGKRITIGTSAPRPRISVEGLLDGSFEKWPDTSASPTIPRCLPESSTPKNEAVTCFITTRETPKGWQVVWMRAVGNGVEPYRSGAGFYKTQKEAQIELSLWADEGLPIR